MFTNLTPMLICADVQASIKFYTDVLGLEVDSRQDDVGKSGWARLKGGNAILMLASPHYFPEAPKVQDRYFSAQYYFYVDDLDALHARVTKAGAEPTGIIEQPYAVREFEMPDPDGHLLVFGQPVSA